MIVSFHPIYEGDINIICAGRLPGDADLSAIKKAECVILPQGCSRELYDMARRNAPHVFPNFDAKFSHPGKIGQIHLFQQNNAPHPFTRTFRTREDYDQRISGSGLPDHLTFPVVFKFNWGGEGDTVFLIPSRDALMEKLAVAGLFEKNGQTGFLIQEYIPAGNRVLRVVVIGKTIVSYWRVSENSNRFCTNLRENGVVDAASDPHLQEKAVRRVRDFCSLTSINLAGFDLLFSNALSGDSSDDTYGGEPMFLEINYFFGRKGLGGSQRYYDLLVSEIDHWIHSVMPIKI